jgi:hypothetical protein
VGTSADKKRLFFYQPGYELESRIKAASAGKVACASEEARWTVALVLTKFQYLSTARISTLSPSPAVWASGVPFRPVTEVGAAVSPGSKTSQLV